MPSHRLSMLRPYLIATGLVLLAFALRYALTAQFGWREPFALFYMAVFAAAWIGGMGPGVLGTLLSAPLAVHFFLQPIGEMNITYGYDWAALAFFLVVSVALSIAAGSARATRMALRNSRDWNARVLASVGDAVIVTDARQRVALLNPEAERLTGLASSQAVGRPVDEVLRLETQPGAQGPVQAIVAADGCRTLVASSVRTLAADQDGQDDADGQGDGGSVHVCHDIHDLLRAQEALAESEQRLRAVLDSDLLAICYADIGQKVCAPNDAFLRMLGHERGHFDREPTDWRDLSFPEYAEADRRCLDRLRSEGHCPPYEKEIRRQDGSRLWVTMGGRVLSTGVTVFFALDTSERKRADLALESQRRLLQSVVDAAPALIAYVDADRLIRVHNLGFARWFGDSLSDRRADSVLCELGGEADLAHLENAFQGRPSDYPCRWRDQAGRERDLHCALLPQVDGEGRVEGVIVHITDQTDAMAIQQELAGSVLRFRSLVQASASIVWRADGTGRFIEAQGWSEFTGRPVPSTLADLAGAVHPRDRKRLAGLVDGRFDDDLGEIGFRLRDATGNYRHALMRVVAIRDRLGTLVERVGTIRDVHDRRSAEDQLRRQERDLRLVLDTTSARLTYVRPDGRIRWANRMAAQWLGAQAEELIGQSITGLIGGVSGRQLARQLERAGDGQPNEFEWCHQHPQYGECWSRSTITPDVDQEGNVAGFVLLSMDVTERKRMEDELRRSETRYRALVEFVPHMVWIADQHGHHVFFNRRWYEFTGHDGAGNWLDTVHDEDRGAMEQEWRHAIDAGASLVAEARFRRAFDASWRWHVVRALPVRDNAGEVSRWYGTCTDIEDQKRAQSVLVQAARRTDEFLAMLSHELRNPLAAIGAAAASLSSNGLDKDQRRGATETISRQSAMMRRMVDDLLDTARVSHGKIELRRKPTDLCRLLEENAADQRIRLAGHGVGIELLPCPDEAHGDIDAARIQQCVTNLITNAVHASRPGQKVTCAIEAGRSADEVALVVRDQGQGIPADLAQTMFEPFVQGATATGRLGLGLALVRKIAHLHGGDVSVDSAGPGRGSTFRLYLPRADRRPEQDAAAGASTDLRTARILIVDDEPDNATALQLYLQLLGHPVAVAFDGEQGLREVEHFGPQVVICDLGMPPPVTGWEFARRLRDQGRSGIGLIAFSGYGRPEDIRKSQDAGFDAHLIKPASPEAIQEAILERLSAGAG